MNLAVHGLEGEIRHGGNVNSYYDDPHDANGRFDFVLANPPFNVNAVDKERLKDSVGPGRRFSFGLPRTDNANYLWIQIFYSALNETGRAGFVMATQRGTTGYEPHVKFLRVLQDLRSKSAAHRKGSSYGKLIADLQMADEGQQKIFAALLIAATELIRYLRATLLAKPT